MERDGRRAVNIAMNRTTPAAIIPQPLSVRETEGEFLLTRETCIVADETTLTTAAALNDALRPALGRQSGRAHV